MKAITCSQCGALIKQIRIRDKFADCDYCLATIPIKKELVMIIPDLREKAVEKRLDKREFEFLAPEPKRDPVAQIFILGGLLTVFLLTVFVLIGKVVIVPEKTPAGGVPAYQTDPAPQPAFNFKYSVSVNYKLKLGAEHIPVPTIEPENLPSVNNAEIKKTIFTEKKIRVEITIEENGEVTHARALNGHKVLRESAERAARKSLFSTRNRKTEATLTYIFVFDE